MTEVLNRSIRPPSGSAQTAAPIVSLEPVSTRHDSRPNRTVNSLLLSPKRATLGITSCRLDPSRFPCQFCRHERWSPSGFRLLPRLSPFREFQKVSIRILYKEHPGAPRGSPGCGQNLGPDPHQLFVRLLKIICWKGEIDTPTASLWDRIDVPDRPLGWREILMDGQGHRADVETGMSRVFRCGLAFKQFTVEAGRATKMADEQKDTREAGHHLYLQNVPSFTFPVAGRAELEVGRLELGIFFPPPSHAVMKGRAGGGTPDPPEVYSQDRARLGGFRPGAQSCPALRGPVDYPEGSPLLPTLSVALVAK